MTSTLTKTTARFVASALLCTVLAACDPYDDDIGGDYRLNGLWTLSGDEFGQLPESDVCEFYFRGNGTGTYSCYDSYGYWTDYPMSWWADGYNLTVNVAWDTWSYTYTISGGWLYLYPVNGDPYLIFTAY